MLGRTDRRWRSVAILGLICVVAVAAVMRLAFWQVAVAPRLQEIAVAQLHPSQAEPAVRGDILDRNGQILATTGYRNSLAAYPRYITMDPKRRATYLKTLGDILDLDSKARQQLATTLDDPRLMEFAPIRRELSEKQSDEIRAGIASGALNALQLTSHAVRIYPNAGGQPGTTLASQLLGFVQAKEDGSGYKGYYGIEGEYDAILAGKPRLVATATDAGRPLDSSARIIDPGVPGEDVTISIDYTLQLQLEKELYSTWVSDKARRVSALVMDPDTGEILAWASVPGYDANQSGVVASTDPKLLQDPIVTQPYEPGSVMKMLTATSALVNKVATPSTRFLDNAVLRLGVSKVHDWDRKGMGRITLRDVIAYSRNIGIARVAARLGQTTNRAAAALYETWQKMGIGIRTGVDVPGEVRGITVDPHVQPWPAIDLANRAFGQSMTVTPVQLATAFTPMINGGTRVQPHFLVAISDRSQDPVPPRRVLPKKVAGQLRSMLDHVTASVPYYAKGALIPHYQVGGKTGTAQIWRPGIGWDRNTYNFSFVGYVGGDAPEAVVALHIDEANSLTHDEITLNVTSYQLFRRIAVAIIRTQVLKRSSDPNAGKPEPGSAAARAMQPVRNRKHASTTGHAR